MLSRAGQGCRAIAATLTAEKAKPWGKGIWEEAYVRQILSGRAVLGEHQSMKLVKDGDGKKPKRIPDGLPITDYYPAAVTEKEWFEVQAARKLRDRRGGRPPKDAAHVNPFAGLLHEATTGKTFTVNGRTEAGTYYRVLVNQGYKRHGDVCTSFPLASFEGAVLSQLAEVDPREIIPDQDRDGNAVLELSGRLAAVEGRLAKVQAQLVEDDGDVFGLMAVVRQLEAKRKETADELAAARIAAASPLAESWGDARGLIETLAGAPDQRAARLRLRAAIARIVDSVQCVLVRHGTAQFAAVQLWFKPGAAQRSFVILHRHARGGRGADNRPASWSVMSNAWPTGAGEIDLRKRADAKAIEKALARLDVLKLT